MSGETYRPIVFVCGHAGFATGEDGPTHADPQAVQLLQENFPLGTAIWLTPWNPQELWPLTATALAARPAVISAFVTRPSETVLDLGALGSAPPEAAATGLYVLRRPPGATEVTLVLQESAVTYAFVEEALSLLEEAGLDALVYSVASAEWTWSWSCPASADSSWLALLTYREPRWPSRWREARACRP